MKITHYCNSFISIKCENSTIVCDPWLGKADNNAWLSYPLHKNGSKILNNLNPNYIYISHLHNDHFDPKILKKFNNKDKVKIIIKKFDNKRLKSKITELNFKNIVEIEPWKKVKLNKLFNITIIPQEANTKDNLKTEIKYDLDTSILIQSNVTKELFYNNVDNPLSIKDIIKFRKFIDSNYQKKIDVACLPLGAASEYPQCFININKHKEKIKVINRSVDSTLKKLKILKPKIFFPAGGNYIIYGKFSKVNKYIAQPENYKMIFNKFSKINIKKFYLEGGGYIESTNNVWKEKILLHEKKSILLKKIERHYSKDKYDYEKINIKNNKLIDNLFKKCLKKYLGIMQNKYNGFNWIINFYLYNNLKIDKSVRIVKNCKTIKKYSIKPNIIKKNSPKLDCHLDKKLFYCLLSKKYNWNIALSGSLVLFKRKPNKFIPDIPFSLNFLTN